MLIAPVPSYAHPAFAEALLPHLGPQHVLALLPGQPGQPLLCPPAAGGRAGPRPGGPHLAESDTAPYVCRKLAPDHAHIWGVVPATGRRRLPRRRPGAALAALEPLFPGAHPYPHAVGAGLGAMNPIVHPPGVLMNAGRIEYSRGEFYFYEEGVTPGVVRAIEALDARAPGGGGGAGPRPAPRRRGASPPPASGPQGDLWAAINGSRMLTQLKAPGSLQTRWLSRGRPLRPAHLGRAGRPCWTSPRPWCGPWSPSPTP